MTPLHFALKLECLPNSSAVILLRTQKQAPNTQNGSHAAIPELCRLLTAGGHCCEVHDMQRWGRDDNDIDVVVRIPGPKSVRDETLSVPYRPKPWNLNLALTDDPSQLPLAEYYDGILPLNLVGEQPDGGGPAQRLEREGVPFRQVKFPRYGSPFAAPVERYLQGDLGTRPGHKRKCGAAGTHQAGQGTHLQRGLPAGRPPGQCAYQYPQPTANPPPSD